MKLLTNKVAQVTKKVSLRTLLIVPFLIQISVAVGLTGWLSLRNGEKAVNDIADQLRNEVKNRIQEHLTVYLETAKKINRINAAAVIRGQLNIEGHLNERYLWQQGQVFNSVSAIYLGSPQAGEILEIERSGDQSLWRLIIANETTGSLMYFYSTDSEGNRANLLKVDTRKYDARIRPWYNNAVTAGKNVWNEIYIGFSSKKLLLTNSQPAYDLNGNLIAVCAVNLYVEDISKFLRQIEAVRSGKIYIVDRSGLLVANSTLEQPFIFNSNREPERIKALNSSDALIRSATQYLTEHFGNFSQIKEAQQLEFTVDGKRQFLEVFPFQDEQGLDWLTVIVVPESAFMERINANTSATILLCLAALAVATVLGILSSRWIIQPILVLSKASEVISQGELTPQAADKTYDCDRLKVVAQRGDELGQLGRVFQQMAEQVKAREQTLTHQVKQLRIEIDQVKRARQVNEITQSDYFQELEAQITIQRLSEDNNPNGKAKS
ncbi:cache domain-containing sensor histidine kinase [Floridanema aerugineum]|uniref:histidine kinase n=1 Tax=Floridaenema aerugineum BLCC-F46 TaxID=3153654 RepID=A0ABV4X0K6_9CYAN